MSEEEILGRLQMIQQMQAEIREQLDRIENAQFELKTKVENKLPQSVR